MKVVWTSVQSKASKSHPLAILSTLKAEILEEEHNEESSGVTAFCVPPCYLFPRTLSTSAVCFPVAIMINMIAE